MARKRKPLSRSKPWILWIAPVTTLVITPLYLHAAAHSGPSSRNMHEVTAAALLGLVVFTSLLGCAIEQKRNCGELFLPVALTIQFGLLVLAIVLCPPLTDAENMTPESVHASHFLPPAVGQHEANRHLVTQQEISFAPVASVTETTLKATEVRTSVTTSAVEVKAASWLDVWKDAGDGYCEEADTHAEFSSLHAVGVGLADCANVAGRDPASVAFDFSAKDGGCDVRFPRGVRTEITAKVPGYEWWGEGGGKANPQASSKSKHKTSTHCYIRFVQPTTTTADVHGLPGQWKDAGSGFCEDPNTRAEFCSLHAIGKSLVECAKLTAQDSLSLAFDFSTGDGGCDIRYPIGVRTGEDPTHAVGYAWFGYGGGKANPQGSGKEKHGSETRCYAKLVQPTLPPIEEAQETSLPAADHAALVVTGKGRFSIVLPCASETDFMVKTVKVFCERTPPDVLHEIIVVDDGSVPPLKRLLAGIDATRCKLKVLRHQSTLGLMIAKQTGGDYATGEFIGFFDCHVSPNRIWHQEMIQILRAGPRRMVIPVITNLNMDSWDEVENSPTQAKCYIDFNGNFMWFDSKTDYVPVISGGLVALTRDWWIESGGFDKQMRGWGGENLDQSLRTWLCGGEIWRAKTSRVAHMWRNSEDPRTSVHYKRVTGVNNVDRVVVAWFDKYIGKYKDGVLERGSKPDVSNIVQLQESLQCKSFTHFLHRFRKVYYDGGVLPPKVFKIRSERSGQCVHRRGEEFRLGSCYDGSWFHGSNQNVLKGEKCCSGIRHWNAMECFDRLDKAGPIAYWCDVAGTNDNQKYDWRDDGLIHHKEICLSVTTPNSEEFVQAPCDQATKWKAIEEFKPAETITYEQEVQRLRLGDDVLDD